MTDCTFQRDVERWFDGEGSNEAEIERHIDGCPRCANHIERLAEARAAIAQTSVPVIADEQLPAFLRELEGRVHAPRRSRVGLWAMASAGAAAIVVALSIMSIFSTGPTPIAAQSTVDEFSTEIDGATTETFYTDDGTATVWINYDEDML